MILQVLMIRWIALISLQLFQTLVRYATLSWKGDVITFRSYLAIIASLGWRHGSDVSVNVGTWLTLGMRLRWIPCYNGSKKVDDILYINLNERLTAHCFPLNGCYVFSGYWCWLCWGWWWWDNVCVFIAGHDRFIPAFCRFIPFDLWHIFLDDNPVTVTLHPPPIIFLFFFFILCCNILPCPSFYFSLLILRLWCPDNTSDRNAKLTAAHLIVDLPHWGRVTHICVIKLTSIGSHNGLSPGRRQTIIWTYAGILLIGPLGTDFREF